MLVFGGGVSLALKLIVDSSFNIYGADFLNVTLSLNFWYFFAAFALVAAALFLVAYAFSAIACRRVARGPILEVLSDENNVMLFKAVAATGFTFTFALRIRKGTERK